MSKLIKVLLVLGLIAILFISGVLTGSIIVGSPQTPQYDVLPTYDADVQPFYRPVKSPSFVEINTFKNISTGHRYKSKTPILLNEETLFIGGSIENDRGVNRANVSLISADIYTGQVYWQRLIGDTALVTDFERIYAEAKKDPSDGAGVVAFDIGSGDAVWKTDFDWWYAVGVKNLRVVDSKVIAETFNKGLSAFYILDQKTGHIQEFVKGQSYHTLPSEYLSESLIYEELVLEVLETRGERIYTGVSGIRESDNSVAWQLKQPIVSNIALGGSITYFFTKDSQLMAVDTRTGEVMGMLTFTPSLPDDFTFPNTPIIVAADEDIVALYFAKGRQLSIFRLVEAD